MTEAIVVGVDGTPSGDAALAWAIDEARLRRGELHVVIAKSPQLSAAEHVGRDGITPAVFATLLREALARVGGAGDVPVIMVPREDHPCLELSLEARARRASLIVVGNHPHGWIRDALGDLPTALLRHRAHCPVVAVLAGAATPRTGRIVVGASASDAGAAAQRWAIAEGAARGASVTAVRAVAQGAGVTQDGWTGHGGTAEAVAGPVVDVLLAAAAGADLLVLGAPHHPRLKEVTGHPTSRALLKASTVPVVLVPPDAEVLDPGVGPAATVSPRRAWS